MKYSIYLLLLIVNGNFAKAQTPYPTGVTFDSIYIPEVNGNGPDYYSFYCYKPLTYDSMASPLLIAIHGTGGNGAGTINNLIDIANRQNAMILAPNWGGWSPQLGMLQYLDIISFCTRIVPYTHWIKHLYRNILVHESRQEIPTYLIGFSAGGQTVSRYMLVRQAYPDSVPIKMAVSADGYYYTFPTDTFLGVPMTWACGIIPQQYSSNYCANTDSLFSFFCNDYIVQYYNENYGVLNGTNDLQPLNDPGCGNAQGLTRYERTLNFYNFCDSNAISRGTTLTWLYQEVPGVGHDEYLLFNTKNLPTDTFTIAERLLFNTAFHQVPSVAPIASFFADTLTIQANDTIFFTNISTNSSSYVWDFGDNTFDYSVNPYHIYTAPGTYTVSLSSIGANGCSNWFEKRYYITVTSGVGVSESTDKNILISPNPSSDLFELTGLKSTYSSFEIRNWLGQLILKGILSSKDSEMIDFRKYKSGLYLLYLRDKVGKSSIHKLVKK